MSNYYRDIDEKPPETIVIHGKDGTRHLAKNEAEPDYSPRLPAQSVAETLRTILSAPAPVPQRDAESLRRQPVTVEHTRHVGDNVKSSATDRMIGAAIAIGLSVTGILIFGVILAIVTDVDSTLIAILCGGAVVLVVTRYIEKSFTHSQAGVELKRAKLDSKLDIVHESNRHSVEALHEQNRHGETMAAIQGDIAIKLRVLDLAAGHKQLADRQQRLMGGE